MAGAQDLALDIPDAAHQLSLFLGRIIVDEALPPSFLTSVLVNLRNDSLGVSVVQATGMSDSSPPHYLLQFFTSIDPCHVLRLRVLTRVSIRHV